MTPLFVNDSSILYITLKQVELQEEWIAGLKLWTYEKLTNRAVFNWIKLQIIGNFFKIKVIFNYIIMQFDKKFTEYFEKNIK